MLHTDVEVLRDFYATGLGQVVRRQLSSHIRQRWPRLDGLSLFGLGYPTPFLGGYRGEVLRLGALMPDTQGALVWPSAGPRLSVLVEEDRLPLPDQSVDRLLVVHWLEVSEHARTLLREIWRVLAPDGRLIVIVPNRRGLWARLDTTPFGQGRPYSRGQLGTLLSEALFSPIGWETALYLPPFDKRWLIRWAGAFERAGEWLPSAFGGVVIVEAKKELMQPIGVPAKPMSRRLLVPAHGAATGISRRHVASGIAAIAVAGTFGESLMDAVADEKGSDAFRQEVMEILARQRPAMTVKEAADADVIEIGSSRISLGNLSRHVRGIAGPERAAEIVSFIDRIVTAPPQDGPDFSTMEAAAANLRIQIAPAEYVQQLKTSGIAFPYRALSPYVVIAYALDEPQRLQYVSADKLAKWSVDISAVHERAIANLDFASRDIAIEPRSAANGAGHFATFSMRDGYSAARILCPEFVKRLKAVLGETFFFGIPNRDFLVAWSADFAAKAGFAAQVAKDYARQPHPLSPEVFAIDASGLRLADAAELQAHGR